MFARLRGHLNREDGVFSVVTLMALGIVLIPLVLVMMDASRASNAASQANGISYNLAYTSANRAVDIAATQEIGTPQLSYDGGGVVGDAQSVMEAQAAMAGLAGGDASYSLVPSSVQLSEGEDGGSDVGLVNIYLDNRSAAELPNCPPTPGLVGKDGQGNFCWNDQRARQTASKKAYQHFSSGSQVRVQFQVDSMFGTMIPGSGADQQITGVRTGVAVLARPCKNGATNDDCQL
jgi:hypothetical protein